MKTDPVLYHPGELQFLKENFFRMTNQQLLDGINALRKKPIVLSSMLNQCRRLGLSRGIQIRWSKDDIDFLAKNFRQYGDVELAQLLTARTKTYRIINDQKVFRVFTHKNVEKKRDLLGWKRTDEEIYNIRIRNFKIFPNMGFTSQDNAWSRGQRDIIPENTVRVWEPNGRKRKVIKINGKFEFLNRYNWEKKHGPIPKDKVLSCKTENPMDCDPDNWELKDRSEALIKNRGSVDLTDKFIISTLSYRDPEFRKTIHEIPELIELKRTQLKLRRTINELSKTSKND